VESELHKKQVSAAGSLAKLSCSGWVGASHFFTLAAEEHEEVPVILQPRFRHSARLAVH
jgi:hypothetical protein